VADTGIGIPDGMGERLFAPFDRLGKEGGDVEGTGLGLSLSRSLVEAMGGTIAATRNEDAGSTFTVTLKASTVAYESPALALVTPESQSTDGLVLYIEDNLANFRLVEQVLSRRPLVRVLPAMQASIGLQLARAHLPDLIILDLNLPDMGGEETLQNLLENPATRSIPVVIASADATPRRIKKLLGLGARAYLTKPIDVSQLLATVDEYLNSSMR
jgi:CheY-like chemotaxis protein